MCNTDLKCRKSKIATKKTCLMLLRNIKSKHKYFILGTKSLIKINWYHMNVKNITPETVSCKTLKLIDRKR